MSNNEIKKKQDPQVIKAAFKLGFTKQDLQPITLQSVQLSSYDAIKTMSKDERQYYLHKKCFALQQRQAKMYMQIDKYMQKKQKQKNQRKGFNPIIKKLLEDHQIAIQKKQRYQEIKTQAKTREQKRQKMRNTIDFGRTSPNFSYVSNQSKESRNSKRSIKSKKSIKSNLSLKSNSSNNSRIQLVRLKQKQERQLRKQQYQQNLKSRQQKREKVHDTLLSFSRKIKTKSQISRQSVNEKKMLIKSIEEEQMRAQIQNYKYKMMKNQYMRQKQLDRKRNNKTNFFDTNYKKQLKQMFQKNQKQAYISRYHQKMQTAEQKKREIMIQKSIQLQEKAKIREFKELHAIKFRKHLQFQMSQQKRHTLYYEARDLQKAKNRRLGLQNLQKMKFIDKKVQQQIVKSNLQVIEMRKTLQTHNRQRKLNDKISQLQGIQKIKKKLMVERSNKDRYQFQSLYQKLANN